MDLIDRKTAKETLWLSGLLDNATNIVIDTIPTVDAVRHGKWVAQDTSRVKFMCSECNARNYGGHENYCPNCGAEMDGD